MSKKTSGKNATAIQNAYIAKTYDRINVLVPKEDGTKEQIKAHALLHGESVNSFILRAIRETIKRDTTSDRRCDK